MGAILGERKIISLMLRRFSRMPGMPIPFGDDVSAVRIGRRTLGILKCDMLVGRTDVPPGMGLRDAARKAVVMTVSDMACKGVKPLALMVSLGIPRRMAGKEDVEQLASGLDRAAREYGTYIIGGDTNEADDLVIGCYALGMGRVGSLILRSGARPGDLVAVTGAFGEPASGLRILLEGAKAPEPLRSKLLKSVYRPKALLDEGLRLANTGVVSSSIDSSDGLAWSLHEIAKASGVGFEIERVPISRSVIKFAELNDYDPLELALYGGEEFHIVLTLKPDGMGMARRAAGGKLIVIGRATRRRGEVALLTEGRRVSIEARGWEHFRD